MQKAFAVTHSSLPTNTYVSFLCSTCNFSEPLQTVRYAAVDILPINRQLSLQLYVQFDFISKSVYLSLYSRSTASITDPCTTCSFLLLPAARFTAVLTV